MSISVWDDEPALALPQLTNDITTDVCVVGLGGSGLSALAELDRLGVNAIGIDGGTVGCGAAGRNGGFVLAGLADPFSTVERRIGRQRAVAAYRLTLEEMDRIFGAAFEDTERTGSLRIAATPDELEDCKRELETMKAAGLDTAWYEGTEGKGLLFPHDGKCQPLARCRRLARAAPVPLFEQSPAIEVGAGRVRTPSATIACNRVVVTVDGGLERLLPELVGRVRSTRLQMLATAPAPEVNYPRPVYSRYGYDYWQQLRDKRVVLGGLRDMFIEEEWDAPAEPTDTLQWHLEQLLRDHLLVRAPVVQRWAGVVAYTEDGLPVIEEVRTGVIVAGAYSGTGNVVGALAGRAAAQLAVHGRSSIAAVLAGPA